MLSHEEVMIRVSLIPKGKGALFHAFVFSQTSGQEVYKWLWSWVTASQEQLLMNKTLKGTSRQ